MSSSDDVIETGEVTQSTYDPDESEHAGEAMARLDAKEDLDTQTQFVDVRKTKAIKHHQKSNGHRDTVTHWRNQAWPASQVHFMFTNRFTFPEITMTVTSDQTLQTHAPKFMPIKKKSQKQLKKQQRARALRVDKAWFDRLGVAAAVEDHTSNEQIDCVQDGPEVVEQCDDSQDQAVIEDHFDRVQDEPEVVEQCEHSTREQRKIIMANYDKIMAGYCDTLKSEHAMNFFGRQLSKSDLAYGYPSITIIYKDVREKTDTRC